MNMTNNSGPAKHQVRLDGTSQLHADLDKRQTRKLLLSDGDLMLSSLVKPLHDLQQ